MKSIILVFIFNLFLLLGCASGIVSVDSSPSGAEVFVRNVSGNDFKNLGVSPVVKSVGEIRDLVGGASSVVLEVRYKDHFPKSIYITDLYSNTDLKINLSLDNISELVKNYKEQEMKKSDSSQMAFDLRTPEEKSQEILNLNKLVDEIFETQRLIQVGRTEDALLKISNLETQNPGLAVLHELRGGLAYIKKDYNGALDAYTKAARLNPFNIESVNMKKYLEKMLNVSVDSRDPASTTNGLDTQ